MGQGERGTPDLRSQGPHAWNLRSPDANSLSIVGGANPECLVAGSFKRFGGGMESQAEGVDLRSRRSFISVVIVHLERKPLHDAIGRAAFTGDGAQDP